jgi:trehalose 6-phosphate phosphatase
VAVITGRPAKVAVQHGGFAGVPGLEHLVVLGHYGAERWDAVSDEVSAPEPHPGVAAARGELPAVLDRVGLGPGTWTEEKGRSVAVHTRRANDPQAVFEALRGPLTELAERHGLIAEPGRLVLELRPPGMDKGIALREYVREVDGGSVLYAGDDLGDLAAFAAVAELRAASTPGLLVSSGNPEVTDLSDQADVVVPGPGGVVALLHTLTTHIQARHG